MARLDCYRIGIHRELSEIRTQPWLSEGSLTCDPYHHQGWGQVQYLYLSTYLSVLDVLEYLVYGNVKVLVLVLDQKVLGT